MKVWQGVADEAPSLSLFPNLTHPGEFQQQLYHEHDGHNDSSQDELRQ